MLPVTLNGEDVYLLHYRADWAGGFDLSVNMPTQIDRSQGGIEARTPTGETLRASLRLNLQLFAREVPEFTVALQRQASNDRRILCPLWPALHRYLSGESVYVDGSGEVYVDEEGNPYTSDGGVTFPYIASTLWLLFEEDWSAWAVLVGDEAPGFTPSATALRVPLLLGRFAQRPSPGCVTDRLVDCPIDFIEDSPASYALMPVPIAPPTGPSVLSREVFAFPFLPDWSTPPVAGEVYSEAERGDIGQGRERPSTFYPQAGARLQSASYQLYQWNELAGLLWFFFQRRAQAEPFWVPHPLLQCLLTADAEPSDTVLHVDEAALMGDNRYLVFAAADGSLVYAHVSAVDLEANTLTLSAPLGADLTVGQPLYTAVLSRFFKPEIQLRFATDILATVRIDFIEVPTEYFNPSGEVLGQTFGALPPVAWLYTFIRKYPSETVVERFTSWERDLFVDGNLYGKRPIEHDSIVDSADPEQSKMTLKTFAFSDNPIALLFSHALEVPLLIEVHSCCPQADGTGTNAEKMFTGTITNPRSNGPSLTAVAIHRLNVLSQKVPVPVVQPECNWSLFSEPCGLAASDWTWSAVIVAISGSSLTLGTLTRLNGGDAVTFGPGWFSFGRFWCGSTAADYGLRTIYNSTALSSGQITVSLARGFISPPAVGATVYLRPGCNRSIASCRVRYNNYSNANGFGGFPFVPVGNPSFIFSRITANPSTQKK